MPDFGTADPELFRKGPQAKPAGEKPVERPLDFGQADPNLFRHARPEPEIPPEEVPAPPPPEQAVPPPEVEPEWTEEKLRKAFGEIFELQRQAREALERGDVEAFVDQQSKIFNKRMVYNFPAAGAKIQQDFPSLFAVYNELEMQYWNNKQELQKKSEALKKPTEVPSPTKVEEEGAEVAPGPPLPEAEVRPFPTPVVEADASLRGVAPGERGEAAPLEAPAEARPIEERIEEARKNYVKAQKELADLTRTKQLLHLDLKGETRKKLEEELARAETSYKELRAEFVGANVERFLEEKTKLLEEKARLYREQKGRMGKVYEWYKGLGQYNSESFLEKRFGFKVESRIGKILLRSINVRTITSWSLLGVGIGLGAGSAIGIGAIMMRRGLAGAASGVGAYDLLNLGREKLDRKTLEEDLKSHKEGKNVLGPEDFEWYCAILEAKAALAGKNIRNLESEDGFYKELLDLWKAAVGQAERPENFLQARLDAADKAVQRRLKTEKNLNTAVKVIGIAVGSIVGSGTLAKALGYKTALRVGEQPEAGKLKPELEPGPKPKPEVEVKKPEVEIKKPEVGEAGVKKPEIEIKKPEELGVKKPEIGIKKLEVEGVKKPEEIGVKKPEEVGIKKPEVAARVELLHHGKPTGAFVEMRDEQMIIHAGRRGIEGALLDLKEAQPEQYQKMLKWLEENYSSKAPGGNTPDKLIHRFMLDYADEHELTIGGGGKDLNRIFAADIDIDKSGEIEIPPEKLKFMEVLKAPEETPAVEVKAGPSKEFIPPPESKLETIVPKIEEPPHIESSQASLEQAKVFESKFIEPPQEFYSTSEALNIILGRENYLNFLRNVLRISTTYLDRVQEMTLAGFLEHYKNFAKSSEPMQAALKGLAEILDLHIKTNHLSEEYLRAKKIHDFVLEFAKAYKETS